MSNVLGKKRGARKGDGSGGRRGDGETNGFQVRLLEADV